MASRSFDIQQFWREVDWHYANSRGDGVRDYLEQSWRRARLSGDADAVMAVASELGAVLRMRGEYERAEALYLEALAAHARVAGRGSARADDGVNLLINLGDVYAAWGRDEDAIGTFDRAEAALGGLDGHELQRSAICNNRSGCYRSLGRYAEARRDLRRASALLLAVPGSEGRRAANAVNLAQVLMCEGRLDDAEAELAPALAAYETLSGGRDVHRPSALATAGQIAWLRGRYDQAAQRFGQAAEVAADKLGECPMVERLRAERDKAARLAQASAGEVSA